MLDQEQDSKNRQKVDHCQKLRLVSEFGMKLRLLVEIRQTHLPG